ncbi:MAG: HAD family hydrolase [Candidatus Omnitrophica bacterium]|nr:HAD family hydrolase [Candidatus Omnitrophota bacterium]
MIFNSKKVFIFDLDGTLVNAYRAIEKSLNFTLRRFGYSPVGYREVKRKVGRGDRIFIQTFFPKKDVDDALGVYRSHHKEAVLKYVRCMPYSRKLLSFLKSKGKFVAIASNRPRYYTDLILEKLKLKKYIDYVLCADEIDTLKPEPKILNDILNKFNFKKKDGIFFGDMWIDAETAKRARIDFVFVEGGSNSLIDIEKSRYNKIVVSNLKEIIQMIRRS